MFEQNTLFGVAGIKNLGSKNKEGIISTLIGARPPKVCTEGQYISVFPLDECLIAGHRSVLKKSRSMNPLAMDGIYMPQT